MDEVHAVVPLTGDQAEAFESLGAICKETETLKARIAALEAENKTDNGIISGLASVVKEAGEDLKQAEAALAERDRRLEGFRLSIVRRKQEAALYGDSAEWEGLSIALGIFDDWRARE